MNNKCSKPVAGDLVNIAGHYGIIQGPKHVIQDQLWVGINPEALWGASEYSELVFSTGSMDRSIPADACILTDEVRYLDCIATDLSGPTVGSAPNKIRVESRVWKIDPEAIPLTISEVNYGKFS